MSSDGDLLTSTQAAVLIGKTRRTVQRLAERELLPFAHKVPGGNGAYLFRRADVMAYLRQDADAA